jgi:hypothetical protein
MNKTYKKGLLGIYVAAFLICIPCQLILKLRYIDPDTGFYNAPAWLPTLLHAALLFAVLAWAWLTLLKRTQNDYPVATPPAPAVHFFAILTGAALLAYNLFEMFPLLRIVDTATTERRQALTAPIAATGLALGVVAGLSLCLAGFFGLRKRRPVPLAGLHLFPAIWGALALFSLFNRYKPLITIPEYLFWVLFLVAANLFFMAHARVISGLGRQDGRNYIIPAGLSASLLGFTLAVPAVVSRLFGAAPTAFAPTAWQSAFILLTSAYALAFTQHFIRSIREV